MPTYDYECTKCAERYEVTRGFNETGGDECPKCGAKGRFIFSPTPSIFKCGGFYVTDTKTKSAKEKAERSESEAPKKVVESKTETKGETKSKTKPAADKPAAAKSEPSAPSSKTEASSPSPKTEAGKQ